MDSHLQKECTFSWKDCGPRLDLLNPKKSASLTNLFWHASQGLPYEPRFGIVDGDGSQFDTASIYASSIGNLSSRHEQIPITETNAKLTKVVTVARMTRLMS